MAALFGTSSIQHLSFGRYFSRRTALAAPAVIAVSCLATSPAAGADPATAAIYHIVGLKFLPTVSPQQKAEVMIRFLALQQECKREGQNYIVSLTGGDTSASIEGLTAGFEQAYIVAFGNQDDYRYYIGQPFTTPFDPVHDEFKKFVIPLLSVDDQGKTDGALGLDFTSSR